MEYPFEPRSTAHLRSGQFWAIPLSDGRFACGRVLDVPKVPDPLIPVSSRIFLAGLLDWVSAAVPAEPTIAGAPLLEQGFAHVKAIRETGGAVLGIRPLHDDGIEPRLWLTSGLASQAWVYRGAEPVRHASLNDAGLPVLGVWGYRVISVLAEHAFVAHR